MNNLNHLLIFKKSSTNPVRLRGINDKKLTWLKILLVIRLVRINDNPPPRGLINLWELLWFGMSGIIFLKGLIINLVNDQLKIKLESSIINIFKIRISLNLNLETIYIYIYLNNRFLYGR